jgi:hypothetical protein
MVAVVLLVLVALEILPCAIVRDSADPLSCTGDVACRFEPLQTCGDGDAFLGALANHPVLLPSAIVPFTTHELLGRTPEGALLLPDGFTPNVDRPPELSA